MKIKLTNITNISAFFSFIESCKGEVYLLSEDGDRINLKSRLCQYVCVAKVFSDDLIKELSLEVENEEDAASFVKKMSNGDFIKSTNVNVTLSNHENSSILGFSDFLENFVAANRY